MKAIEYKPEHTMRIRFGRIKPFRNICAVTGESEWCNAEIEYIPSDRVLDIVEYRKWFESTRNRLIEDIAVDLFNEITVCINPQYLCVRVFLEGNPNLTDWCVEIKSSETI